MTILSERKEEAAWRSDPEPVVWCDEIDGVLYPHPEGPLSAENITIWTVPCEEEDGVLYPYGEGGERVVHGDPHFATLTRSVNMVQYLLRDHPQAKLFSDIFIYWIKGNNRRKCAPDLCVLPRVADTTKTWNSVRLWQELSWPTFIMEILSIKTEDKDTDKNFKIYQNELKTPEYFICEPRTKPMKIAGYRLIGGVYQPIQVDEGGRLWSEQLECWIGINDQGSLQFWEDTEQPVPDYTAALQERDLAIESSLRDAMRAEQERRKAERERHRAELEARQADQERARAEQERQRAEQQTRLRETAEARIRELEEELRRRAG